MSDIRVRLFEARDQGDARGVILDGLREHFGAIDESLNPDVNDIGAAYRDGIFVVAERDGALVGTGALSFEPDGRARVSRMYVRAEHRRSGVATAILHELIERAWAARCTRLVLSTHADWWVAHRFYEASGFVETQRTHGRFGEGIQFERTCDAWPREHETTA